MHHGVRKVSPRRSWNATIVAAKPDISDIRYLKLKAKLKEIGLSTKSKKKELAERLRAASKKKLRRNDDDDDDNSEDEESVSNKDETPTRAMQTLTFKDVEESVQTFSGNGTLNVKCWMKEFEEMAEVCQWTSMQKIIYCKQLLRGPAKSFVRYEKCSKSWKQLKKALLKEFEKVTSTYKVHEMLRKRMKRLDESYRIIRII